LRSRTRTTDAVGNEAGEDARPHLQARVKIEATKRQGELVLEQIAGAKVKRAAGVALAIKVAVGDERPPTVLISLKVLPHHSWLPRVSFTRRVGASRRTKTLAMK
jgi:hypothetical protein